ncbi:hypothetical protein RvY_03979 [Ramazzottius varieornatus]|uniref:Uncharacterized protein n=1 Tax=Ramazzottius varieornatus TaxID=947166 RepID=A0A1D1V016_RAMVA|nr:hypothetical protein RvY_03979 [Ramazzottius varieornatus]
MSSFQELPMEGPLRAKPLVRIAQNIQRMQQIVATNDAHYECNKVTVELATVFRDFLRVDYTDVHILDAYGLPSPQPYKASYY